MKKYKRFFAFGCSITKYFWPTWADIIGKEIPVYENWADLGAGNHYIFNSIVETNAKYKFDQDDLVIVMWSSIHREDRYKNNKWEKMRDQLADDVAVALYDERGFLMRDLAYITAAKEVLRHADCRFTAMHVFWHGDNHQSDAFKEASKHIWAGEPFDHSQVYNGDVLEHYKETLKFFDGSMCETVFDFDWDNTKYPKKFKDFHPMPLEQLQFINTVWPDLTISDSTVEWVNEQNTLAMQLTGVDKEAIPPITNRL